MEIAPNTQITFDLYGKLSNASEKFKELYQKGQQEQTASSYTAATVVADKEVMEASINKVWVLSYKTIIIFGSAQFYRIVICGKRVIIGSCN